MRRIAPAIALLVTAPLVAEFLLGDFTVALLAALVVLIPLYGGGALLIREVTRRTGRGRTTMVLLALAYGVVEEGLVTQSLFDPGYAGAHLLDRGFVPALGIAVPWTVYVLALHTVWSINVPIALVEEWTGRRTAPWLRTPGVVLAGVLFVAGAAALALSSRGDGGFAASPAQAGSVLAVAAALVVIAFLLPRAEGAGPRAAVGGESPGAEGLGWRGSEVAGSDGSEGAGSPGAEGSGWRGSEVAGSPGAESVGSGGAVIAGSGGPQGWVAGAGEGRVPPAGSVPRPLVVLALGLGAGALFIVSMRMPAAWLAVASMVVALGGAAVCLVRWSRRPGWGPRHRLAVVSAALVTYGWNAFLLDPFDGGGPVVTPVSRVLFAGAAVVVPLVAARRVRDRDGAATADTLA